MEPNIESRPEVRLEVGNQYVNAAHDTVEIVAAHPFREGSFIGVNLTTGQPNVWLANGCTAWEFERVGYPGSPLMYQVES